VAGNSQHDVIPLFHTTDIHPHNEARIYFSHELNDWFLLCSTQIMEEELKRMKFSLHV